MAYRLHYATITKYSNLNLIDRLQYPWLTASVGVGTCLPIFISALCLYRPGMAQFNNPFFVIFAGVFVCIFAPLALTADVLALRGLRLWKRSLLLPWLVLYAVIILLVMSVVLSGIFHRGFHWQYLLLAICSFCFLSAWRHVRYQVPTD